jgi:transcriptional regulator with XRE-family HTH domain
MIDLKAFRRINSITQVDLASYLEVGQGFISQIEKGSRPLPREIMSKLLANPYGWDTSMLVDSPVPVLESAAPAMNLSNVEILLREMLAEKEAKIDALNEIIWELKAENALLKKQIKYKGAHAEGAAGSFAADAV